MLETKYDGVPIQRDLSCAALSSTLITTLFLTFPGNCLVREKFNRWRTWIFQELWVCIWNQQCFSGMLSFVKIPIDVSCLGIVVPGDLSQITSRIPVIITRPLGYLIWYFGFWHFTCVNEYFLECTSYSLVWNVN